MDRPAVIQRVTEVAGDFTDAAPGHRFNLYFPVWRADWSLDKTQKAVAIRHTRSIKPVADLLRGLRQRQQALISALPEAERLNVPAHSTSPFATGLGNEHPVENGFAFLTPYGLPYLAGSGVKGVLRRAAEELVLFGDEYSDENAVPAPKALTMLDVWWLFGFEGAAGCWWSLSHKEQRESPQDRQSSRAEWAEWAERLKSHLAGLKNRPDWPDFIERAYPRSTDKARFVAEPTRFIEALDRRRQDLHLRGALDFWDVFPYSGGGELVVEIMTPHYSDYYQGQSTPHDAGQPNPIPFLAVPAGSEFDFHVACQPSRLPEPLRETWSDHLRAIFQHAFDWLGFGAKTSVGYGAMETEAMRTAREEAKQRRQEQQKAEARQLETQRLQDEARPWPDARLKFNRANRSLSAEKDGKTAIAIAPEGQELLNHLPPDVRQKVESNQFVRVTAYVADNKLIRVDP